MATNWSPIIGGIIGSISGLIGVIFGWMLRYLDEVLFGPKLKIDCNPPGNTDENPIDVYMRFRVQNTAKRRVARNCRAYVVGIYKASKKKVISDNLIADTFQLNWAGWEFDPRDIPAKVEQYVDLVRFPKQQAPDWLFYTKPPMTGKFSSSRLADLPKHRGTYCFKVVVAGDGAVPKIKIIYVDYDGNWENAAAYE
jgi:hypothetical protein